MEIGFDPSWVGNHGIARFAREVSNRHPEWLRLPTSSNPTSPFAPFRLNKAMNSALEELDVGAFFLPGFLPPVRPKRPTVVVVHDLMYLQGGASYSRARSTYLNLTRSLLRNKQISLATVSKYSAEQIASWLSIEQQTLTVVGNGVSDVFFRPSNPRTRSALLVSGERPNKNLNRQLAGADLASSVDWMDLVLPAEPSKALELLLGSLTKPVNVRVGVSDAELSDLYSRAGVLSICSLDEGFGLPAVEAFASGCPVVHSGRGGLAEVAQECGVLADPGDPQSIAAGIDKAIENGAALSLSGRKRAEGFTWEAVDRRVIAALDKAVHASPRLFGTDAGRRTRRFRSVRFRTRPRFGQRE